MQAIIFADRVGKELDPLSHNYCPALLPLAGKTIIQHTIESMKISGVKSVTIVLGPHFKKIKNLLENGCRWSLNIQYLFRKPNESYVDVLKKCEKRLEYPIIATRGDVVNKHWLNNQQESPKTSIGRVIYHDINEVEELQWSNIKKQIKHLTLSELDFHPLLSSDEYHSIMLKSIDKINQNPIQNGKVSHKNLRFGTQVSMQKNSLVSGKIYVDDYSQIAADAKVEGPCYIGRNCIIDKGALIKNSVILDNTFIGAGMRIENAIVCKSTITRTDLNNSLLVTDSSQLSSTSASNKTPLWQRFMALSLFTLTLPLMILHFIFLTLAGYRVSYLTIDSNKRSLVLSGEKQKSVRLPQIDSTAPYFNRLILLYWVVKGDLRLYGRDSFYQASNNDWQQTFNKVPKGLISLAQLLQLSDSDLLQYELMEIERNNTSFKWLKSASIYYSYLTNRLIKNKESGIQSLATKNNSNLAAKL